MKGLEARLEKLERAARLVDDCGVTCILQRIVNADGTCTPLVAVLADARVYCRSPEKSEESFLDDVRADCAKLRRERGELGSRVVQMIEMSELDLQV